MENDYKVADINLAEFGRREISLAETSGGSKIRGATSLPAWGGTIMAIERRAETACARS